MPFYAKTSAWLYYYNMYNDLMIRALRYPETDPVEGTDRGTEGLDQVLHQDGGRGGGHGRNLA